MQFVSWNVNGIRAALKKGFLDFAGRMDADVFCLQEIRATPGQVEIDLPGYEMIWHPAEKKGYAGTAMLSRIAPQRVIRGLGDSDGDKEGRVLTMELADFYLVTAYAPNAQRGLMRLDHRLAWDAQFLEYLKSLERTKPVVFCGDLNVAHKEIDLANPQANRRNAGFTDEERAGFDNLIAAGFVDTFREFVSEGGHYTWWSQRLRARERNIGWRIDYFGISGQLRPRLQGATILPEVTGSDHCPVTVTLR